MRTASAEETTMHEVQGRFIRIVAVLAAFLLWSSSAVARAADTPSASAIENIVRSSMAENHLKAVIVQAHANLSANYLRATCSFFVKRLRDCVAAGGGYIE